MQARKLIVFICSMLCSVALLAETMVPPVSELEPESVRNSRVIPPANSSEGDAQEEANKRIVLQWHYEFFDLGLFREASMKYMAEDFRQNDPREPSGRENYIKAFEGDGSPGGFQPMPAANRPPIIAVLADGDLVMTVIPDNWSGREDKSDPSYGSIHCNMYRLKDGKIVEMWVSGAS